MNCSQAENRLHDMLDGELPSEQQHLLDEHLAGCAHCREVRERLLALRLQTRALPRAIAPTHDLWSGIYSAISARSAPVRVRNWIIAGSLAAAAALALAAGLFWRGSPDGHAWTIEAVAGAPKAGARTFVGETQLRVGDWLETDDTARARLAIGNIGEAAVAPNSRLRLVAATSGEHRLELARGSIDALIWAPPRLFFVDTPAATAVDLGCAYTLSVDDTGTGTLRVTAGWVALENGQYDAVVPAGMMCVARPRAGPGTPFRTDAPDSLRAAIERFDSGDGTVADVLAQAIAEDAITLWHLLMRAPAAERGRVFDALAAFAPPPATVTRDGIVRGDAAMRVEWADVVGLGGLVTIER